MCIFETGNQPARRVKTKWLVGLTPFTERNRQYTRLYWQLLETTEFNGPQDRDKFEIYARVIRDAEGTIDNEVCFFTANANCYAIF